jgi:predicted SprT family Zn-dependent metalloprotease
MAPPALQRPAASVPASGASSTWVWSGVAALVIAFAGWLVWSAVVGSRATAAPMSRATPIEALQQKLLRENVGKPGDPILNQMFADINAKHFSGALPALQVLWEPRLADVSTIAAQAFKLEGMFGHVKRQSVILLNPDLQADRRALARALSHEMVHAHLFVAGNANAEHGPEFQSVLRRLSQEGAFEGLVSSDEDRANLRAWLDAESARLDAERSEIDRIGAEVERDRVDVERALADLNARMTTANAQGHGWPSQDEVNAVASRRDDYNRRAVDANERIARDRTDVEHFNREVARYNLMLVYPDGLDEKSVMKARAIK